MSKVVIITHSGKFHADEVFATAILQMRHPNAEIEIVRTRDEEEIEKAYNSQEIAYIIDVGSEYNPRKLKFDHHQWTMGGRMVRINHIPYASFGLVYIEYALEIIKDLVGYAIKATQDKKNLIAQKAYESVDEKLVSIIDANDNGYMIKGQNPDSINPGNIIYDFNPVSIFETKSSDEKFIEAVSFAKKIVMNLFCKEIEKAFDNIELQRCIDEQLTEDNDEILILPKEMSYHKLVFKNQEKTRNLKYIISPGSSASEYSVIAVPLHKGTKELRKPFPQSWATLRDRKLEIESGVEGAIFCHSTLFIAIFKTLEGAIQAAKISLNN